MTDEKENKPIIEWPDKWGKELKNIYPINKIPTIKLPTEPYIVFCDGENKITLKGLLRVLRSLDPEIFDRNIKEITEDKND